MPSTPQRSSPVVEESSVDLTRSTSTTEDLHSPKNPNPSSSPLIQSSPIQPDRHTVDTTTTHHPAFHHPRPFSSEASSGRPLSSDRSIRSTRSSVRSTAPVDNVYVNTFRFNQDGSCFVASTTEGFRVFTCSPLSEFARREISDPLVGTSMDVHGDGRVNIIGMLYRSHSFAFVTHKEPKKVQLWNDREGRVVGTIRCRHMIRNVLLGREVIAVVTENAVYVYLAGTITPLHVLATGYNPQGLCAMSSDANSPWILACPTITPGAVRIQTSETIETPGGNHPAAPGAPPPCQGGAVFQAHQNPLGCLSLNPSGTIVATASILGTVIKIFRTHDGMRLYELRLASVPHEIRGIAIRGDGQFVAATSNSSKVHIFKLDERASLSSSTGDQHTLDPSANISRTASRVTLDSPRSSTINHASNFSSSPALSSTSNGYPTDWDSQQTQSQQVPCSPQLLPSPNSSSSSSSSSFTASAFGSLTSAFVNQSRGLVAGTLKTVLPKYFAPIRSFAQLALPVDSELDVRSCNPAAIAQHRAAPCEDCLACARRRGFSSVGVDVQPTVSSNSNRPRSSSGAARFVEGLGRSTSSFLTGSARHYSQDEYTATSQQSICPCGFGTCWGSGPLVTFAGDRSNHFYSLHHDGFFYEARFDSQYGGQCQILSVSPWFAPRRDFNLQGSLTSVEAPGTADTPSLPRLSFSSTEEGFSGARPPMLSLSDFNLSDIEKGDRCRESHYQDTLAGPTEGGEFNNHQEELEVTPNHDFIDGRMVGRHDGSQESPIQPEYLLGEETDQTVGKELETEIVPPPLLPVVSTPVSSPMSPIRSEDFVIEGLESTDTTGEWEQLRPEQHQDPQPTPEIGMEGSTTGGGYRNDSDLLAVTDEKTQPYQGLETNGDAMGAKEKVKKSKRSSTKRSANFPGKAVDATTNPAPFPNSFPVVGRYSNDAEDTSSMEAARESRVTGEDQDEVCKSGIAISKGDDEFPVCDDSMDFVDPTPITTPTTYEDIATLPLSTIPLSPSSASSSTHEADNHLTNHTAIRKPSESKPTMPKLRSHHQSAKRNDLPINDVHTSNDTNFDDSDHRDRASITHYYSDDDNGVPLAIVSPSTSHIPTTKNQNGRSPSNGDSPKFETVESGIQSLNVAEFVKKKRYARSRIEMPHQHQPSDSQREKADGNGGQTTSSPFRRNKEKKKEVDTRQENNGKSTNDVEQASVADADNGDTKEAADEANNEDHFGTMTSNPVVMNSPLREGPAQQVLFSIESLPPIHGDDEGNPSSCHESRRCHNQVSSSSRSRKDLIRTDETSMSTPKSPSKSSKSSKQKKKQQ